MSLIRFIDRSMRYHRAQTLTRDAQILARQLVFGAIGRETRTEIACCETRSSVR